ncbi:two-component system response regulator NarL [Thiocapsa marina]|uniref:Two component transcriptional regulator, LuxR family n=1 Tax=Thiocapsa marina 5811 TaxID=768671 RepID=F9UBS9_9GAMM|nr:two-component system response regulator NarL [Thiocapsa marina]EGV18397.1 two component transcriptional regulator, LuxR family [Thiocapsa marina 5811]
MTTDTRTTVVVIDDHPLFRKGVSDLIAMAPELVLVGQAGDGEEGMRVAAQCRPDLILLDLNMTGMNGIQTLERLRRADLDARVVMLTVSDSEDDVIAALRAGADGYLLKDMEPEDILHQLLAAGRGRLVISQRLTELIARALRHDSGPVRPDDAGLTPRERQVLALLAEGASNKLIARELDLSLGTVKVHVKHILKKLKLRTRVEAAVWAVRQTTPEDP